MPSKVKTSSIRIPERLRSRLGGLVDVHHHSAHSLVLVALAQAVELWEAHPEKVREGLDALKRITTSSPTLTSTVVSDALVVDSEGPSSALSTARSVALSTLSSEASFPLEPTSGVYMDEDSTDSDGYSIEKDPGLPFDF